MTKKLFLLFYILSVSSCGGGTAGTAIDAGNEKTLNFSGVVVASESKEVPFATISLLNTDDVAKTDEAGAFELVSSDFSGKTANFEIKTKLGQQAFFEISDIKSENIDISVLIQKDSDQANLLDTSLRAKIVKSCSPLFINTRTVKQISAIPDGTICSIEVDVKSDAEGVNYIPFELQTRQCSSQGTWQTIGNGETGTSGKGKAEISFEFLNNNSNCVYRIVGRVLPNLSLSSQIFTLRKIRFDR